MGEQLREPHTFRLFGDHLGKSKAPLLHNTLFQLIGIPWSYEIHETSDLDVIEGFIQGTGFVGCAITMPNKVRAIKCVDELDSIGAGCGSINTVYLKDDGRGGHVTVGTNTDTVGISQSLKSNYPEEVSEGRGKPGLVYGAGGASRSAVYALYNLLGVSKVYVVNRVKEEVDSLKEDLETNGFQGEIVHVTSPQMASTLEAPVIAVLTVPDFEPSSEDELLAKATLDVFKQTPGVVLEMCYNPVIKTRLFQEFLGADWKVVSGVEAMIHQGVAQQVLWTGISLEELPVEEVVQRIYKSIEN